MNHAVYSLPSDDCAVVNEQYVYASLVAGKLQKPTDFPAGA